MNGENEDCTYKGESYSPGALICVRGEELLCRRGEWVKTGRSCDDRFESAVEKGEPAKN